MRLHFLARLHSALILAGLVLAAPVTGAPPTLDYLYPAGAQRGTTVTVTAAGTTKGWPVQTWCSHEGVSIKAGRRKGTLIVEVDAQATPGTCWVRVHDAEGGSNIRPFIIGTLPEATEKEPNDSLTDSQDVGEGSVTVNGRLEKSGDVDVFAVTLKKGQTLVASMVANTTLKSPMDATLQVVSEDGFVLEQNDDCHRLDPQVVFTAPADGRYLVRTFAFPETPNSSISFAGGANFVYRLTLCTTGFADHPWPLAVSSKEPVELVGWNIPSSLKATWTGEPGSAVVSHPQVANVVPVAVEPHPCVVEAGADAGQAVTPPVTVSGRIDRPGEVDVYTFSLKRGEQLSVNIAAAAIGSPVEPVLRLLDSSGKVIQDANPRTPRTDPSLTVRATASTTYRLEVRDLYDTAGLRSVYRLRLAAPAPDYSLKVAADRFTGSPGKPVEIQVTVDRQNGFREPVEIEVPGLEASSVVAKPSDKSVKLQVKAGDSSGAFRVVGRVKGQDDMTRTAVAEVKELGIFTPHLWLSVQKGAGK